MVENIDDNTSLKDSEKPIDWRAAQAILDAFPSYALLVDEDHNIVLVNHLVKQHLKRNMDDIIGAYCPRLIHGVDEYPGCPLKEAKETGRYAECELYDRNSDRWIRSIMYPTSLTHKNGKRIFFHQVVDTTSLKKAEFNLRQGEERYRTLFEKSNDAFFVHPVGEDGLPGRFVDVNNVACNMLGYSRDELLTMTPMDLAGSMGDEQVKKVMSDIIEQKNIVFEDVLVSRSGENIPVEMSSHIFDFQKEPTVLTMARDITERVIANRQQRESYDMLKKRMESTIRTISMIVETRDSYTSGHQQRVSKIACAIAREMRIPKEKIEAIRIASLLHDIGKISVPVEILSKPGRLNSIEMEIIQGHPGVSFDILKHADFPTPVADIVLQHHERFDGSGYPSSLVGDEILIEARIIGVADVIEAMSSRRPYRDALGIDVALKEIIDNKSVLYDPDVVEACRRLFVEQGLDMSILEAQPCLP